MKLVNKTRWRTDDLRRLVAAALEADGIGAAGMRVEVRPARGSGGCSGYAWYHSHSMVVRVPTGETALGGSAWKRVFVTGASNRFLEHGLDAGREWDEVRGGWWVRVEVTKRTRVRWDVLPERVRDDLARVVIHEAAHCRGVHHAEMHGSLRRRHQARHCTDDRDVGFAAEFQIRLQPPKAKVARDVVGERAAHAARKLAQAERKLKLAKTVADRWRAKVRYYERRAAATRPAPGV